MSKPFFSIIILSYNQKSLISNTIDSCLKQSFKDYEIIIVDDDSTDGSKSLINSYCCKYDNISSIIHQKNLSSHVSRFDGVNKAKGKYILFLDGDDSFIDDAFKNLYETIVSKGEFDVAEFSYELNPGGKLILPDVKALNTPRMEYFKTNNPCATIWNKVYETKMLKSAFSMMKRVYINMSDDIYESICIAYVTKLYVQFNDNIVVSYSIGTGVSTKKHSFENNKTNCESIFTMFSVLEYFCMENKIDDYMILMNNIKKNLLSYMIKRINCNTVKEDICPSLIILPQTFDYEIILPEFKKMYEDAMKYRIGSFSIINYIKHIVRVCKAKLRKKSKII